MEAHTSKVDAQEAETGRLWASMDYLSRLCSK